MFLSQIPSGVYFLSYKDDSGRRRKVSTRSKRKIGALKFVQSFKQGQAGVL